MVYDSQPYQMKIMNDSYNQVNNLDNLSLSKLSTKKNKFIILKNLYDENYYYCI